MTIHVRTTADHPARSALIDIESEVNDVVAAAGAARFLAGDVGPGDAERINQLVHLVNHTARMAEDLRARWNEAFAAG